MIHWLLARFDVALCDLDLIARILAAQTLRVHAGHVGALNEATTRVELGERYAQVALETGLPRTAGPRVVALAWDHVAAARAHESAAVAHGFRFYP